MGNKGSRKDSFRIEGSSSGSMMVREKIDYTTIPEDERVGAILTTVPLLARLNDEERAKLGGALVERKYRDGEYVVKQGEVGHSLFILMKGEAEVTLTHREASGEQKEKFVNTLHLGDVFGEAALLSKDARRGANVKAHGDITCLVLDREKFEVLFAKDRLNVQFAKRQAISAELTPNVKRPSTVAPANAKRDKDGATRALILNAVKGNLLFEGLSFDHKNLIIEAMWQLEVKAGTTVIKQGDQGDNFFVVQRGTFDIFITNKQSGKTKKVATRADGTAFGELALMYNAPRAATVTASTDCVAWVIDRFSFRRILANVSDSQLSEYETFLKKVELLAPLSVRERAKVAEALEECVFQKGQVIMKEGEKGDSMYIVRTGEVSCSIEETEVKRYTTGMCFGERALMKDEPRAATLTCVTSVKALKLDRAAFKLLLGPLEDIMQHRMRSYSTPSESKLDTSGGGGGAAEGKLEDVGIKKEDLKVVGTLGKGSFGHVQLVRDPKTGRSYALKAVNKAQIVQTGQQGHIMSEKKVMASLNHPFLTRLYATYKDKDRLYFLLEVSLGGELFSVLRARTFFDEDTARFYAASVVLAFEHMHSKQIIYRDLKPENLLLDDQGYLKVTDFGFAKVVTGRTYTLCGTPDYLAPEIVAGKGHGKGVDWWTLGILIYEMLSSYPPFYDEDPMKTYAKIMHGKITYPSHFSKEAIHLIQKLLHHKPTKRMGVVKGGAKLIKEHAWFANANFDWDALYNKKMKAPIMPKIKGPEDLSNFDDYPEDEDIIPYHPDGTNWEADF